MRRTDVYKCLLLPCFLLIIFTPPLSLTLFPYADQICCETHAACVCCERAYKTTFVDVAKRAAINTFLTPTVRASVTFNLIYFVFPLNLLMPPFISATLLHRGTGVGERVRSPPSAPHFPHGAKAKVKAGGGIIQLIADRT